MLAAYHTNNNPSELAGWNTNYWKEYSSSLKFLPSVASRHMSAHRCTKVFQVTKHLCVMEQAVADMLNHETVKEVTLYWDHKEEKEMKKMCENILMVCIPNMLSK